MFIENTRKRLADLGIEYDTLPANIKLSDGNTKLKKSGIVSFNLIPITHCPLAGSCKAFCYATVGQQAFASGVKRRAAAFKATLSPTFVQDMHSEIQRWKKKIKAIRVHDSGDFYSMQYLLNWLEIARLNPDVKFYAYSKSLPFIHKAYDLGLVPPNFRLIQSVGGLADSRIRQDLPHARIFSTLDELTDAGYADASETDDVSAFSDTLFVGLVVHGARKGKFSGTQSAPNENSVKVSA
ncbi:hypothetical protein EBR25_13430 [bacterium]|nr:hypothetical protein [bacterium]